MIRPLLIAFTVIVLGMGFQGVALAIVCPPQPEQTGKDWEGEVNAAIARIGPVSGGEVKTKVKTVTQDLLGKLPDAGKIYLEQMKYSTICSSIRDDKTLSEGEKRKQMTEYDFEIQKAKDKSSSKAKHPAGAPQQSKQPGKNKLTTPQSIVPAPVGLRAETSQPSAQKLEPAVLQSLSQNSAVNSPIIIGNNNSVGITSPADKPLGRDRSDTHDVKLYIECEGKRVAPQAISDGKLKGLAFLHSPSGATDREFKSVRSTEGQINWMVNGRAFVCQVTNYGTIPVLKVHITFGLRFLETVWLDSPGSFTHRFKSLEQWPSQIRKLDPGTAEAFTFIIKNTTNDWLEVIVPEFVDLQILGETTKRSVYLARPDDDPGHLGTYYKSVFPFPPANFAEQAQQARQNRPENRPQSPSADSQQRPAADTTE